MKSPRLISEQTFCEQSEQKDEHEVRVRKLVGWGVTVNYYSTPKNLSTASPAKEKPFFVPRFSPGVTPQP